MPEKKLPRATCDWALDSGGFSELNLFGKWTVPAIQYVEEVRRYCDQIGRLDWAAIQDWMCEPIVLAKTGLTVTEHQTRTIDNYIELLNIAPDLPWVPVLQGWTMSDYKKHLDEYLRRNIDLTRLATVGIGSVCRRQHTGEVEGLIRELHAGGLKLHGFGFKLNGLPKVSDVITSSDSLAWSFTARKSKILLPGCEGHINCANCMRYALEWREKLLLKVQGFADDQQLT